MNTWIYFPYQDSKEDRSRLTLPAVMKVLRDPNLKNLIKSYAKRWNHSSETYFRRRKNLKYSLQVAPPFSPLITECWGANRHPFWGRARITATDWGPRGTCSRNRLKVWNARKGCLFVWVTAGVSNSWRNMCAALLSLTVFAYRVFFSGNYDNSTFEFKEMKITGRKSEIVF